MSVFLAVFEGCKWYLLPFGGVMSPAGRVPNLHKEFLCFCSVALKSCICSEGTRFLDARAEVVSCAKFSFPC